MFEDFIKKSKKEVALFIGNVADATSPENGEEDPDFLRVLQEFQLIENETNELLRSINRNMDIFKNTLASQHVALEKTIQPFNSVYNLLYDKSSALYSSSNSLISINQIFCENTTQTVIYPELREFCQIIQNGRNIQDKRKKYKHLLKQQIIEMKHMNSQPSEKYRKYLRKYEQYSREFSSIVDDLNNKKRITFTKTLNAFIFSIKQLINDANIGIDNRNPKTQQVSI